ncbi:hypothetical protein [Streptomyces sp. GC420]|uniref:hypothetical protein n=1 Tax=Streptomyces sp. GC420 TaxID=2697568 RepID=UPI001414FD7D|nr:hypothetical protein [Streptomyces sp. GC420]NBM14809.1 hypothetical protein [Streptomyces sp. GC420]
MEAVILILVLLFVTFVAMGAYAGIKLVGAAKRGVDRTVAQARRTVEDTALRAKSVGQPGVAGELAQLRLALRTSMRATQDALHAGAAQDASLRESLGLFERLSVHGRELDEELKRLERDPDKARIGAVLPSLRERTERITHSADSLRWAARDRARQFADDELTALSAQIEVESGALRHVAQDPLEARVAEAGRLSPAEADGAGAATAARDSGAAQQPDAGERPPRREAITARDPRQDVPYTWQKTTRPETTT